MGYSLVERRRRAAARGALYGSLVAVGLATLSAYHYLHLRPATQAEVGWYDVDWRQAPAARVLQQYVRIDSNGETGDQLAAALYLAGPLEAAGLAVHVEPLPNRRANLWAILEGEQPEALVLHSHLDVSPVRRPDLWEHPPFAGVIEPPWLHGRGAFDMKSYAVAQLLALLRLAAEHPRPRRSVIFLATADEERGSDLGMRWILREHPELVARFWAVLTEGGVVEARNLESLKYWGTEVGQKRFVNLYACAASRERLAALRQDVLDFSFDTAELTVDPEIRRFWQIYHPSRDRADLRQLIADPEPLRHDAARVRELPEYLRATLRTQLVPFPPEPAPGGGWQMRLILQLLPGADADREQQQLLPPWMVRGVTLVSATPPPPATISPVTHPVYRAIQQQIQEDFPGALSGPFFLHATATDARFLRAHGIPSYGFSPFLILTPDTLRVDKADERIGLPGLAQGVGLYERLLHRIAAGTP